MPGGAHKKPAPLTTQERKQRQLQEEEGVARSECSWKEMEAIHSILSSAERTFRLQRKREEERRAREEREAEQAAKTLRRRQRLLAVDEQKVRLVMMQDEQLELEAMLRNLEKDIRRDVFDIVAEVALRVKYFNKTIDVIIRNEQTGRREAENTERYERLVLKSRMDSQATQMLVEEKLARLKRATEEKVSERKRKASVYRKSEDSRSQSQASAATDSSVIAVPPAEEKEEGRAASKEEGQSATDDEPVPAAADKDEGNAESQPESESKEEESKESDDTTTKEENDDDQKKDDSSPNGASEQEQQQQEESVSATKDEAEESKEKGNDDDAASDAPSSQASSVTHQPKAPSSSRHKNVPSRINASHPPEYYDRVLERLQEKETTKRESIEADETHALEGIINSLDYIINSRVEQERAEEQIMMRSRVVYSQRQQESLVRKEGVARHSLASDGQAAWKTIMRKHSRELLDIQRREEADHVQLAMTERKLSDRRNRVLFQKAKFEARSQQKVHADESAEEADSVFAPVAMMPVPPHVLRDQQARDENSAAATESQSGGMLSHEDKRRLVAHRIASGHEETQRHLIEKDERIERYAMMSEMNAPPKYPEREARARNRRALMVEEQEKKTIARLQYEEERNQAASHLREERKAQRHLVDTQRSETSARVELSAEAQAAFKDLEQRFDRLNRAVSAVVLLNDAEDKQRNDVVAQEKRVRQSLSDTEKGHRPKGPRKPIKPLPPVSVYSHWTAPRSKRRKHEPQYNMQQYHRPRITVNRITGIEAMMKSTFRSAGMLPPSEKGSSVASTARSTPHGTKQEESEQKEKETASKSQSARESKNDKQGDETTAATKTNEPAAEEKDSTSPRHSDNSRMRRTNSSRSSRSSTRKQSRKASRAELKEKEKEEDEKKEAEAKQKKEGEEAEEVAARQTSASSDDEVFKRSESKLEEDSEGKKDDGETKKDGGAEKKEQSTPPASPLKEEPETAEPSTPDKQEDSGVSYRTPDDSRASYRSPDDSRASYTEDSRTSYRSPDDSRASYTEDRTSPTRSRSSSYRSNTSRSHSRSSSRQSYDSENLSPIGSPSKQQDAEEGGGGGTSAAENSTSVKQESTVVAEQSSTHYDDDDFEA